MWMWAENSFGSGDLPVNWEDICSEANAMIKSFISENPDANEEEIEEYSENLWALYCSTDKVGNVVSNWN